MVAYIIIFLVAFFLGYQFCKVRWQPEKMLACAKVLIDLLNGTIDNEEAKKRYRELDPGD